MFGPEATVGWWPCNKQRSFRWAAPRVSWTSPTARSSRTPSSTSGACGELSRRPPVRRATLLPVEGQPFGHLTERWGRTEREREGEGEQGTYEGLYRDASEERHRDVRHHYCNGVESGEGTETKPTPHRMKWAALAALGAAGVHRLSVFTLRCCCPWSVSRRRAANPPCAS